MIKWRRRTDEESRGNFFYLRIDDRLIHGQVVVGWGTVLDVNHLVLVNDRIAANPYEREFYRQVIPESMGGEVESLSEAMNHDISRKEGNCRCIFVVASVEDARRLIEGGKVPDALVLGGIHAQEGRKRILDYLYLSEAEISILQGLATKGIKVIIRDLPTSDFMTLQEALQALR
jgi:mannose/fructose/N-acetylgalactosamine-specific phosphotransferase system component IIB